jgi:hypothetical protein
LHSRLNLGRFAVLILALVLAWQAPAPAIAQDACGTFAVATAPQPVGHPLSDNVITLTTAEGEHVEGAFEEPRTVEPSPKASVALVRSLGGVFGLMDVRSGAVTPLSIPEDEQPMLTSTYPAIRNAQSSDFMLLSSGPDQVWLVELTSGDALNLAELGDDGPKFLDTAQVSPDGKWVIYSAQNEGFLISLETPGEPEPIDSQPLLPFPSFDRDNRVVYGVGEDGNATIRTLDPATGMRTDLADAHGVRIIPIRQGGPLLLVEDRTLLVLDDGDSAPRALYEWTDAPSGVVTNTAGTHLLVSDVANDVRSWHWVEIASGISVEIPELTEMTPVITSPVANSVTFAPAVRIGPGTPGTPYRSIDLSTGVVATPLMQDSDEVYQAHPAGDLAGRYTIVNAVSPGQGRIWIIDSQQGTATQIASSPGNAEARVSPDGCQLAVSIYTTIGEGRTSTVTVTSMQDGSTPLTIPDALLLGWAAVEPAR